METINSNEAFISNTRTGDNYSKGWKVAFTLFIELIVVTLVYAVIQIPTNMVQIKGQDFELWMIPLAVIGMAYAVLIAGPIGMSADWVFLKAVRREKIEIKDMFSVFDRNYWNAVLAGLIKGIIVIFGFLMLIVPGVIFACRLAFVNYLIIDEKMEALEALKASWAMTKGHGWTIFGMFWLAVLIVIAGLLCFIFGVLISAMWISAAFAVLYHSVSMKEGIPQTNGVVVQPGQEDSTMQIEE